MPGSAAARRNGCCSPAVWSPNPTPAREGHKQVVRQTSPGQQGNVHVWLNGAATTDTDRLHAAALVADGYSLFLLGPMLLASPRPGGALVMELAPPARITVFGRVYDCDILRVRLTPGLGLSPADDAEILHRARRPADAPGAVHAERP